MKDAHYFVSAIVTAGLLMTILTNSAAAQGGRAAASLVLYAPGEKQPIGGPPCFVVELTNHTNASQPIWQTLQFEDKAVEGQLSEIGIRRFDRAIPGAWTIVLDCWTPLAGRNYSHREHTRHSKIILAPGESHLTKFVIPKYLLAVGDCSIQASVFDGKLTIARSPVMKFRISP